MTTKLPTIPSIHEVREKYFPSSDHPYRQYERWIDPYVLAETTVLDVGCGRTAPDLQRLHGRGARLIGIDLVEFEPPAPKALDLRHHDVTHMHSIADATIDLVMCRSVMEHVAEPEPAFAEIFRVLKPGGVFVFLTANLYDYASIIAALVPNALHPKIVQLTEGRNECDTFPTFFRCNTRRTITRLASTANLEVCRFAYVGQYPSYLKFNRLLFWLGSHYELYLRKHPRLHPLRGWILTELRKPAQPIPQL